jgi:hypothetical protein
MRLIFPLRRKKKERMNEQISDIDIKLEWLNKQTIKEKAGMYVNLS